MIVLNQIPEYHSELVIDGRDYNYETPNDELQYHIESNIEFIENEENEISELIGHEPSI